MSNPSGRGSLEQQQILQTALEAQFSGKLIKIPDHAWEFGLSYSLAATDSLEVFARLRDDPTFLFHMLIDVTCVDWLDSRPQRFEVVYQLLSLKHLHRLCLKISASEENPEVPSIRGLWPAANFMEREVWDMYGVKFSGHGDLRRVLLYDEFVGHPLRKDYPLRGKQPRVPLRIPELRNTSADMNRDVLVSLPMRRGLAGLQQARAEGEKK